MTDTTKKPSAAEVAIAAIREYFEDRQDASMEPGEDRFHGNKEMALLEEVATVEAALTRLSDVTQERDALKRRMVSLLPLFEEARDALTAIPLASAKLHNVRLDLAERMDRVGVKANWDAYVAEIEAPK